MRIEITEETRAFNEAVEWFDLITGYRHDRVHNTSELLRMAAQDTGTLVRSALEIISYKNSNDSRHPQHHE